MKEINLGPLYPQSHYVSRYTKVTVMGQALRVNLLENHIPALEFWSKWRDQTDLLPNKINQPLKEEQAFYSMFNWGGLIRQLLDVAGLPSGLLSPPSLVLS